LVIQIGAPKNVKRLVQRIGRANHRYNAPSKALLVPANRFEVVECVAALEAAKAHDLDGDPRGAGPRDVLCQHILIAACAGPFNADDLFAQVTSVGAYSDLTRAAFDDCLDFCATGGYSLRAYDKWQRLLQRPDGDWQLRDPRSAQRIRMNIGTIQDTDTLKVRLKGNFKPLGEIEEGFAATLTAGDTFLIGGEIVRYEGLRELTVQVTRRADKPPKIATFMGTKFATSTQLSARVSDMFRQDSWPALPDHTADWLTLQTEVSKLPEADRILVESYEYRDRHYACFYGFAGRNAQQTLGLLLTQRMEQSGLAALGFVATDYATLIWGLEPVTDPAALLQGGALRDGLTQWLAGNAVMKRTFRASATIAGLIERNSPQARKSGRQATFSSDILYDTLQKYDPDHLIMQITHEEAMRGLVDFGRIEEMIERTKGRVDHVQLTRVSPLAAPMMLEMGRVPIAGEGRERLLADAAETLMHDSGLRDIGP
jgi:ATP-dependent Lhr-like helicase